MKPIPRTQIIQQTAATRAAFLLILLRVVLLCRLKPAHCRKHAGLQNGCTQVANGLQNESVGLHNPPPRFLGFTGKKNILPYPLPYGTHAIKTCSGLW